MKRKAFNAMYALPLQDFESAIRVLESLLEREDPSKLPKIHSAMGRVFLQLGKHYT